MIANSRVPSLRIRVVRDAPVEPAGGYVLYWMTSFRRTRWNFSLDRAVEWSAELGRPLVILEALRCDYRWASDRLHTFVVQGMLDNQRACAKHGVTYHPYVELQQGAGAGLLKRLAADACVVVTDEFPCFFLPAQLRAARREVSVLFEAVDSNGLLPMRASDRALARAFDFRRHLQKTLPEHLGDRPESDTYTSAAEQGASIAGARLPQEVLDRWPAADVNALAEDPSKLSTLPIDHSVRPCEVRGGESAALAELDDFLKRRLERYGAQRSEPQGDASSELSAYLHFGHLSAHEVTQRVLETEGWTPARMRKTQNGARGWWGLSETAEAFVDELVTWRELGFNMCCHRRDYDRYESLPDWAQKTLQEHAADPREHVYPLAELEAGRTHDPLWNAAQMQLVRSGRIHNYLRMLWGKKILEWSRSPREALAAMIELNNKYALDGRNPNSYSGIFWVLGRYDRAWGPERPIFGKIRYMTSDNTARKFKVNDYIRQHTGPKSLFD